MKLCTLVLVCLKLLCAVAWGEHCQIEASRQVCNGYSCTIQRSLGSGVTIGKLRDGREAVLTAAHVLKGTDRVKVHWYHNARIDAQVIAVAERDGMDVALLAARLPEVSECHPLMTKPPAADAEVIVNGYPGGRDCIKVRGTILGIRLRVAQHSIRDGMSGGAVVCGKELAGIVTGFETNTPSEGVYTAAWLIRQWLQERLGYLPECAPGPPQTPTPIPDNTVPGPPDAGATVARIEYLEGRVSALQKLIADLQRSPGPQGPAGPQGPQGPKGDKGDAGAIASADARIVALEKELAAIKAEKIKVQVTREGKLIEEKSYPRTGPIVLDFAPVNSVGSR